MPWMDVRADQLLTGMADRKTSYIHNMNMENMYNPIVNAHRINSLSIKHTE